MNFPASVRVSPWSPQLIAYPRGSNGSLVVGWVVAEEVPTPTRLIRSPIARTARAAHHFVGATALRKGFGTVTKQLYTYRLEPGDPDHLPASYFTHGVVEAEPEELEAMKALLADHHPWLLEISPGVESHIDLAKLRAEIGSALQLCHGEVSYDAPCVDDAAFIAASDAAESAEDAAWREKYGADEQEDAADASSTGGNDLSFLG
jgi:hypothetical protein